MEGLGLVRKKEEALESQPGLISVWVLQTVAPKAARRRRTSVSLEPAVSRRSTGLQRAHTGSGWPVKRDKGHQIREAAR